MTMRAAYSMCRTRLGISVSDFEDAWTIRGRIATTPPAVTKQSTGRFPLPIPQLHHQ